MSVSYGCTSYRLKRAGASIGDYTKHPSACILFKNQRVKHALLPYPPSHPYFKATYIVG